MSSAESSRTQFLRFLVVGGIAVATDAGIYFLLTHTGLLDSTWSKRVSFAAGALWAFVANKLFTFRRRGFVVHEPVLFSVVYLIGWLLNSLVHDLVLQAYSSGWVAFLMATGVSTTTNFVGQKWLVFRTSRHES